MKDRIGNKLAKGDKVVISLPDASIFGFVANIEETGLITGVRHIKGGAELKPGRILVSCVVALPVDANLDMVAQLVKVYDPDKHEDASAESTIKPN